MNLEEVRREEMMSEVNSSIHDEIDKVVDGLNEIIREAPYNQVEKGRFDILIQDIRAALDRYESDEDIVEDNESS